MIVQKPFDPDDMRKLLLGLAPQQRLIFGLACSERLYPNYVAFANEQGWGDPEALRVALDIAWDAILGRSPSLEVVRRIKKRVDDAQPDTEEFETILVSSALDAAVTAGLVLELLEADDPELVVEIASLCRDTVDMYVQAIEHLDPHDAALEKSILLHQLMQAELRRQREDLHMLATASWTPAKARHLKDAWRDPEVSNINLSRPR